MSEVAIAAVVSGGVSFVAGAITSKCFCGPKQDEDSNAVATLKYDGALGSPEASLITGDKKYLMGVDIGGTAIKLGIITVDGKVISSLSGDLGDDKGFKAVCDLITRLSDEALEESGLTVEDNMIGMGVCVPGSVDAVKGQVNFAANFPDWPRPAPLSKSLGKSIGLYPTLENDGNVALLAEIWQGAAKGAKHAIMLTLGTGVGSAIVSNHNLINHGLAGEVGHMIWQRGGRPSPNTGVSDGIIEEYVSARAIGNIAQEAVSETDKYPDSMLRDMPVEDITCKDVFDFARKRDALALEIMNEALDIIGVTCINLMRVFDTDSILFGGGMVAAGDILINGIRDRYKAHHWNLTKPDLNLSIASLGTQAGMIGAAYLAHPERK